MCINMIFPKGFSKTSDEVKEAIISGLHANDLCSGYAYKKAGTNHIILSKGYLHTPIEDIAAEIIALDLKEDDELMVHGRLATCGARNEQQAHPFVLSSDIKETLMVKGETTKPVLIHNGIFTGLGSVGSYGNSDTAEFCNTIGSSAFFIESIKRDPEKTLEAIKKANSNLWGWSKVAIMFPDRDIVLLGDHIETSFGFFSNSGYKNRYLKNRGGIEVSKSFIGPKSMPNQLLLGLKPSKEEGAKIQLQGKGGNIIFFRERHGDFNICFSNTRLIPNNYNILFLRGKRNDIEAFQECKLVNNIKENELIKLISVANSNRDLVYKKDDLLTNKYDLLEYNNALRFFTFCGISTLEKAEDPLIKHDLLNLKADYEELALRSITDNLNGTISKSYSKRIHEVLWNNIEKQHFDLVTFKRIKNPTKESITMYGFKNMFLSKLKVNSEKNVMTSINILSVFLFYIERTNYLEDSTLKFTQITINEILTSTALKYGILKKWYYPPINYGFIENTPVLRASHQVNNNLN